MTIFWATAIDRSCTAFIRVEDGKAIATVSYADGETFDFYRRHELVAESRGWTFGNPNTAALLSEAVYAMPLHGEKP